MMVRRQNLKTPFRELYFLLDGIKTFRSHSVEKPLIQRDWKILAKVDFTIYLIMWKKTSSHSTY